jgi:RNA polymerase sigma factor FliA
MFMEPSNPTSVIPADLQVLWDEFRSSGNPEGRSRIVVKYLDLVRSVIGWYRLDLWKNSALEREDVYQFGILGLMDAVDRFSPEAGVKFETYAVPRIRGAILDAMRKLDWMPRSARRNIVRENQTPEVEREDESGRPTLDAEIAETLMLSLEEYSKLLHKAMVGRTDVPGPRMKSLDGEMSAGEEADESSDVLAQVNQEERRALLTRAIEGLPNRDRIMIALYYFEGLRLAEIARVMRISESRVSQIHGDVLETLKGKLAVLQV